MTQENPLYMQNNQHSARTDRQMVEAVLSEGVVQGLAVTPRSEGANMSVDCNAGRAVIKGDDTADQGSYFAVTSVKENFAVTAAHASLYRKDRVIYRINDTQAGGPAGNNSAFAILVGTPNTQALAAAPAVPTSAISLAVITLPPNTLSVQAANITEDRLASRGYGEVPFGVMLPFCGPRASVPPGYLFCDGAAVSRETYFALWSICGTAFGGGDGSTTFNLPDPRQRHLVGVNDGGGPAQTAPLNVAVGLGTEGGQQLRGLTAAQLPQHNHTVPDHAHTGKTTTEDAEHRHDMDHAHPAKTTSGEGQNHRHNVPNADANGEHGHGIDGETLMRAGGSTHVLAVAGNHPDRFSMGQVAFNAAGLHGHNIQETGDNKQGHAHEHSGFNFSGKTGFKDATHRHDITPQGLTTNNAGHAAGTITPVDNLAPFLGISFIVRAF